MGKKRRGRDRQVTCANCGRSVPRAKAVDYNKRTHLTTDLKGEDNVTFTGFRTVYYCVSCGKHSGIFERKKEQARRRKQREMYG
jgi:ribosomal protein S26